MRLFRLSTSAALAVAPALLLAACGSTQKATAGTDGGAVPFADAASGTGADAAAGDASSITSWIDAASTTNDAGVVGAVCPPVDASGFTAAPHAAFPTMAYGDGGVLTKPQVITFTFKDTPNVARLEAFGHDVIQSSWFADVVADYSEGAGGTPITAGPAGQAVRMTGSGAAGYTDGPQGGPYLTDAGAVIPEFVVAQVAAAVTAGTISAPTGNEIYAFYFPPVSTISMGSTTSGITAQSCVAGGFFGYHGRTAYGDAGVQVAYAIMPDCGDGGVGDIDQVTLTASHEVVEAATDPETPGGWYVDQSTAVNGAPTTAYARNIPWLVGASFGESGDNCADESNPDNSVFGLDRWILESGALVQRIWSPSAAAKGKNPCVPVPPGEAYYNASTDKAIYIAEVGVPFTVTVSTFADAPRSSWRLDARDRTSGFAVNPAVAKSYLSLMMNGGMTVPGVSGSNYLCANNGTTTTMTVTLLADPSADKNQQYPFALGAMVSADVAFTRPWTYQGTNYNIFPYHLWPFLVMTSATAKSYGIPAAGVANGDPVHLPRLIPQHHSVQGVPFDPLSISKP